MTTDSLTRAAPGASLASRIVCAPRPHEPDKAADLLARFASQPESSAR